MSEKISVIICSWNRERLLRNTLESLCRLHPLKKLNWEVIVVLNDCTDGSRAVVEQFRGRLPIMSETEARPGLSHARNKGIEVASGGVLVWIDDDVRAAPEWLCAYETAFLQYADVSLFGGPILPEFEGGAPAWLQRSWHLCDSAFAARRVPDTDREITVADQYPPYGANFALRASVQRQFRYDIRLGARPGKWKISGEETDVIQSLLASGHSGRWVRTAIVHHVLPRERQSVAYVRGYYESAGRQAELKASHTGSEPCLADRLNDLGEVMRLQAGYRMLRIFSGSTQWVPALVRASLARGRWIGRYRPHDGVDQSSGDQDARSGGNAAHAARPPLAEQFDQRRNDIE
ncbi:MAG TPA: glycosyltransferase family A protein [Xanthobacteraceae bacterium]|nr:glycosyltransferase family A protein [Xanthobacteraceae bacterium]